MIVASFVGLPWLDFQRGNRSAVPLSSSRKVVSHIGLFAVTTQALCSSRCDALSSVPCLLSQSVNLERLLTTAVAPPFALLTVAVIRSAISLSEVRLVSGNAVSQASPSSYQRSTRKIAVWRNRASQLLLISEHDVRSSRDARHAGSQLATTARP